MNINSSKKKLEPGFKGLAGSCANLRKRLQIEIREKERHINYFAGASVVRTYLEDLFERLLTPDVT